MSRHEDAVWINPGRRFGSPCIGGTNIPVCAVAERIWDGAGVEDVMREWDITRGQILNACWFVAAYGIDDVADQMNGKFRRWGSQWSKRWGEWASTNGVALWKGDADAVPDPPCRDGT